MDAALLLAPLRRRLANLVARAVVRLVADDTLLSTVQLGILRDETRDRCERFQQYGFTSHPHPGAEAVVVFVGGLRDHALVTNVDDRRYRKRNLAAGETALYTDEGDYVLLKRGRIVELLAGTKVRAATALVECTGDVDVAGVYQVDGTSVVGPRGAAVDDAIGGSSIDTQARTAINTLLARCRAHGLIAP